MDSDVLLMRRIADGDEAAFRALYARYGVLVHGISRRVLGDAHAQEECTQDVFVQVWRRASRYDAARGSVGGWLVQIARSRAIEAARRAARRDVPSVAVDGVADTSSDDPLADLDEAAAVAQALAELPPDQYDAIRLAYFDGLPQTEIAARLGVPLGTVKSRVRLGLERLRSTAATHDLGAKAR